MVLLALAFICHPDGLKLKFSVVTFLSRTQSQCHTVSVFHVKVYSPSHHFSSSCESTVGGET